MLAASCGSDDDGEESSSGTETTTAESPETTAAPSTGGEASGDIEDGRTLSDDEIDPDGTIRLAHPTMLATLDPHKALYMAAGHMQLYDRVLQLDQDRQVIPWLASEHEVAEDGLSVTLVARDGVTFSDGEALDGETLKLNIERARDVDGSQVSEGLQGITSIDLVDPMTIRLNLDAPDVTVLHWLASTAVAAKDALDDDARLESTDANATTTPYRVVSFDPTRSVELERRPDAEYWNEDAWRVNRYEITQAADFAAVTNALKTGALDEGFLRRTAAQAEADFAGTDVETRLLDTDTVRGIYLRSDRAGFDDQAVRQAIAQALDRESLVESGALQLEAIYAPQWFAPGVAGSIDDYDPLAFDTEAAAATIEEAGGFSFELAFTAGSPPDTAIAEYAQQALGDIGVDVTLLPLESAELISQFAAGQLDAAIGATGGQADPTMQQTLVYLNLYAAAPADRAEEIRVMIDEANALPLDSDERREKLEELNRTTLEEAWAIPVYRNRNLIAFNPKVRGLDSMAWSFHGTVFDPTYWVVAR